eukprot:165522_1
MSELCKELNLSLTHKIKFEKAINTLTLNDAISKSPRRLSNISLNNHAYYVLGDGVSSSTVYNEANMNLIASEYNHYSSTVKHISVTIVGEGG